MHDIKLSATNCVELVSALSPVGTKVCQDALSPNGQCVLTSKCASPHDLIIYSQLSREEEASIGEEKEVRREDQEKINRFSRLHLREKGLEEELTNKQVCFEIGDLTICERKYRIYRLLTITRI